MSKEKENQQEEDVTLEEEDEEKSSFDKKNQVQRLREKLKKCRKERQEYLDGWQRAKAEFVNSRKRLEEDRQKITMREREEIIGKILSVADSFEMAFRDKESWESVDEEWRKGIEHIYGQLRSFFEEYNVEEIAPKKGESFDPNLHTAIRTVSDNKESEDVVSLIQKGYSMNGRVIRSAKVEVSK